MTKPDFTLKFIKDSGQLPQLSARLLALPAFALDIETVDWWNRHQERVALIQIAFRTNEKIKVIVLDALAISDFTPLRLPFEDSSVVKIVHNAGFDAVRIHKHYNFKINPVFDTMAAARRSGERRYSLKAQAETHLNLRLDKSPQGSDWSRRPLDSRQLYYAALDAYAALLLYESQRARGLTGEYHLKPLVNSGQNLLPLEDLPPPLKPPTETILPPSEECSSPTGLSDVATALLGIIAELPSRYSPAGLAASIGSERVGVAGWIIDRRLGTDAEPDEETVRLAIADLCEKGFVRITETRRLEATEAGAEIWRKLK